MSDLAETVKRLRGLADKAIAESHTIHFGNNAHNAFRDACQPELIAGILEAHADALERLERERDEARNERHETLIFALARITSLEAELAAVTTERRTPTPDELANVLQAYIQFLTMDEAIDAIFHLFSPALAQHPTPSQGTTPEKEAE